MPHSHRPAGAEQAVSAPGADLGSKPAGPAPSASLNSRLTVAQTAFEAADFFDAIGRPGWSEAEASEIAFLSSHGFPTRTEQAILRASVPHEVLCSPLTCAKAADVIFFPRTRAFEFHPEGERAFLIAARDVDDRISGYVAWSVEHPFRWGVLSGPARPFCLGAKALQSSIVTGGPVSAFRSPLSWMKHRGAGICILTPWRAWIELGRADLLLAEDARHCGELRRLLRPPAPNARVAVAKEGTV